MTDEKLIEEICNVWIKNGGDAEGFDYTQGRILEELRRREQEADHE
jgi:hypothetical protein